MLRSKSDRRQLDIWPGFVDAISTLLLVLVFLLVVFILSEVFLTHTISGKDNALEKLNLQISELNELLDIEKEEANKLSNLVSDLYKEINVLNLLNEELNSEVLNLNDEKDKLKDENQQIIELNTDYKKDVENLNLENQALEEKVSNLNNQIKNVNESFLIEKEKLNKEQSINIESQKQLKLLNNQIADLRIRMAKIQAALEASEIDAKEKGIKITELGKKLNAALAKKVSELAKYRSEFFGKLKDILGDRKDIVIVGDRFILQSEILFESGSAKIGGQGLNQLTNIAIALSQISEKIPKGVDWVIQIQGHTDNIPISNSIYPSNWELSVSRAISVAQIMINNGIPPDKISVAGYGEYRPLIKKNDQVSLKKNRRIEFKLTQP